MKTDNDVMSPENCLKAIENMLCNVAQIINVIKQEWQEEGSWSDWDEETRESITNVLYYDVPRIRTTITKSAKVDGLLDDINDALQRYNDGTRGADGAIDMIEQALSKFHSAKDKSK